MLKDAGVYQDVRIVGYDNVPLAGLFIPSITTISQPLEEMCNSIIQILFPTDEMDKDSVKMLFTPKLVTRESA